MAKKLMEMTKEELWQLFPIQLEEHNPKWRECYAEEKVKLTEILGEHTIRRIHHIGSTSVEGLLAKPIVDILLEIHRGCDLEYLMKVLEQNGYLFSSQPDNPPPHMMFLKGYTEQGYGERIFHLHIRYPGDWDELYFRDFLREHPDVARAYGQLKTTLQDKCKHNRDRYTEEKTEFIRTWIVVAKNEFHGGPHPEV